MESQSDAPMFATLAESCEWLQARGISRSPKQIIEAAAKGLLTLWAGLPDGAYIPFARRRKSTPGDTMHFIESGEDCPSEVVEFGERPSVKGEMIALTRADCVQFLQTNEAHIRGEGFENNARVSEALGDFGKVLIVKHIDALRLKGDGLLSYHAEMSATSILEAEIARIDNLAWALGWLLRDRDASDEARYRQIQAWDERIRAMSLPTMDKAGRPARPSRGVPVAGFDKRESEYVAVASVRERAVEDHYVWPCDVDSLCLAERDSTSPLTSTAGRSKSDWRAQVRPYVLKKMREGSYSTAKDLYRALEDELDANTESPFSKGSGTDRGKLIVREVGQPVALKTFQNFWKELKADHAAQRE